VVPKSGCLRALCWILLCLVGANLAYFVWNTKSISHMQTLYGKPRAAAGNIYLTSEPVPPPTVKKRPHLASEGGPGSDQSLAGGAAGSVRQCAQIGAYTEIDDAERWQEKIAKEHYKVTLQSLVVPGSLEYWVLIVTNKGRNAALAVLHEVQKKKLDSYLVTEGAYENAISLGLFVNELSAMQLSEQVSVMGYSAGVYERTHHLNEYWLQIDLENEAESRKNKLHELVNRHKEIKILNSLCETFAHSPSIS